MLTVEEILRITERFDVYDLIEALDLDASDLVYAFEEKIELCEEVMNEFS